MKEPTAATIHVTYRFIDGYHVFTSEDVKGIYVASKEARIAFDNVGPVLKDLIELKLKHAVEVEPTMTFDAFMAYVDARKERS